MSKGQMHNTKDDTLCCYRAKDDEIIVKAPFIYRDIGMAMDHNYLCAVCREYSAVIDCGTGILQPCWDCMARGYYVEKKSWLRKLVGL